MSKKHSVIVIPGLGGGNIFFERVVNSWDKFGYTPYLFDAHWKDGEKFEPKLNGLLKIIDRLLAKNNIVSLVGTSAGGSMALNAFYERQDSIHRVVNICGRLRAGENVFPTLDQAAKSSPSFRKSVEKCEETQTGFSEEARSKIMTMRALLDEIVPPSTITMEGARNIQIYSVEHMLSIAAAMTICVKPIIEFIS